MNRTGTAAGRGRERGAAAPTAVSDGDGDAPMRRGSTDRWRGTSNSGPRGAAGPTRPRRERLVPGSACPCSASANSCAVPKRSAGSFSSARSTAASTCSGTALRVDRIGRGRSVSTRAMIACAVLAAVRRLAGEHLVRHRAERVDVAAPVDRAIAGRLLGRHVLRRAERESGLRDRGRRRRCTPRARCRSRRSPAGPSCSRMFSGLRSRWITPCACA